MIPKPVLKLLAEADHRPSLYDLWVLHKFDSGTLTMKAKVPPGTVQAMLRNQPISRDHAQRILAALSALLHKKEEYTLQSVYVALVD